MITASQLLCKNGSVKDVGIKMDLSINNFYSRSLMTWFLLYIVRVFL